MKKKLIGLSAILLLATGCGKIPELKNGEQAIVSFGKDGEMISVDDFYKKIKDNFGLGTLINMIDTTVLENEFSDYKEEATKSAKAMVDAMIENYGGEAKLLEALQQSSYYTIDAYQNAIYMNYLQNHAVEEYAKAQITDKEIKDYYNNKAIGDMEISHILITSDVKSDASDDDKKKAEDAAKATVNEIIEKLNTAKKNNEDINEVFTNLAKEYSKDSATKDKGGALGKITYGDLSKAYDELIDAAKKLKDGEYSTKVITTELGYHVILKTKSYEKDTLENLTDSIREILGTEYVSKNQKTIGLEALQYYRKKHNMEIQDDELQKQYSRYMQNLISQANSKD